MFIYANSCKLILLYHYHDCLQEKLCVLKAVRSLAASMAVRSWMATFDNPPSNDYRSSRYEACACVNDHLLVLPSSEFQAYLMVGSRLWSHRGGLPRLQGGRDWRRENVAYTP